MIDKKTFDEYQLVIDAAKIGKHQIIVECIRILNIIDKENAPKGGSSSFYIDIIDDEIELGWEEYNYGGYEHRYAYIQKEYIHLDLSDEELLNLHLISKNL